ncbi:MAG: hypothetical protein NT011_06820, partial [Kiritimatiellaeota bacterium]|nr:hypothetical protein [Kiritimatiellota bacterium]
MRAGAVRSGKVFFAGLCMVAVLVVPGSVVAEETTNLLPQIQAVYGGYIRGLNIIQPNGTANQLRLFLMTDFSANSVFYADLNYALADPFSTNNFNWRVVPDFNAQANFGTVDEIAVHQESGRLFVADDKGLLSSTVTAGSLVTNIASSGGAMFRSVRIHDSALVAFASGQGSNALHFGALNSSGTFVRGGDSPIGIDASAFSGTTIQMEIHPTNHCVYIIDSYGTNGIKKSSTPCTALSSATTFSAILISSVISNWGLGRQIGFGPDGRMFIGSKVGVTNTIAYSDDDGASWTVVNTGVIGKGYNFDTAGTGSQYQVAFGKAISTNKGAAGTWSQLGVSGPTNQIRANDSAVKFDPLNSNCIYFASDQGVGCTTNSGINLAAIDFGLEAVAIRDMDMTQDKTLGWTASSSGLRRGIGAAGALQWAVNGTFPNNDSAPYYAVAIDSNDVSGNTVYAGNSVVYKTIDGGTNWTKVYEPAISGDLFISSIKAVGNTVFAGIYGWSFHNGGLVYSANGGATWGNIQLESGTNGVNVNKILLTTESGSSVAYVGAAYNTNNNTGGHIYRVTTSGTTHISLGSSHISIRDLALDSTEGIYASGWTDNYAPVIFYKSADSSDWTQLTTNGLSNMTGSTGRGPVLT